MGSKQVDFFISIFLWCSIVFCSCSDNKKEKSENRATERISTSDTVYLRRYGERIVNNYFGGFDFNDRFAINYLHFESHFSQYADYLKRQPVPVACMSAKILADRTSKVPHLQDILIYDFNKFFYSGKSSVSDSIIYAKTIEAISKKSELKWKRFQQKSLNAAAKDKKYVVVYRGNVRLK